MKAEHHIILVFIEAFLKRNPSKRFCEALLALNINEFRTSSEPGDPTTTLLRNNSTDTDAEVIKRIERAQKRRP